MINRNPLGSVEKAIYQRMKARSPTLRVFSYMPFLNETMPFVIIADRFFVPAVTGSSEVMRCTFELRAYTRETRMEELDVVIGSVLAALDDPLDDTDDYLNSETSYESVSASYISTDELGLVEEAVLRVVFTMEDLRRS